MTKHAETHVQSSVSVVRNGNLQQNVMATARKQQVHNPMHHLRRKSSGLCRPMNLRFNRLKRHKRLAVCSEPSYRQVGTAHQLVQAVVNCAVKHQCRGKRRAPGGASAHSGTQSVGADKSAAVGDNAEQRRRVLGEFVLAGVAQKLVKSVHSGEQRDVNLIF